MTEAELPHPEANRLARLVAEHLRECVGSFEQESSGAMSFQFGSTQLVVTPTVDDSEDRTYVHVKAYVASEVPTSEEFFRWVAETTGTFLFGHLTCEIAPGQRELAELTIEHTLLGDYLDLEELRVAVAVLAVSADNLDDLVVERFGGLRFIDI